MIRASADMCNSFDSMTQMAIGSKMALLRFRIKRRRSGGCHKKVAQQLKLCGMSCFFDIYALQLIISKEYR
jgi:hypothetical protein